MSEDLPNGLNRLLALARGLPEPQFNSQMRIVNWPESITSEVRKMIERIETSGNSVELRMCADILDTNDNCGIPAGLLHLLTRSTFDNPSTPFYES